MSTPLTGNALDQSSGSGTVGSTPPNVTLTPAQFRQQFNMFADPLIYNDFGIQLWITLANTLLDVNRWAELINYGAALYVAHELTLMQRDILTAQAGGVPGAVQGILTSKAVDKVSAGYDALVVALEDGGEFNMTRFGIQFLKLARWMGSGGVQLSPQGPRGLLGLQNVSTDSDSVNYNQSAIPPYFNDSY